MNRPIYEDSELRVWKGKDTDAPVNDADVIAIGGDEELWEVRDYPILRVRDGHFIIFAIKNIKTGTLKAFVQGRDKENKYLIGKQDFENELAYGEKIAQIEVDGYYEFGKPHIIKHYAIKEKLKKAEGNNG